MRHFVFLDGRWVFEFLFACQHYLKQPQFQVDHSHSQYLHLLRDIVEEQLVYVQCWTHSVTYPVMNAYVGFLPSLTAVRT